MQINEKGFTVIEIMIVVMTIGILAIIGIPNFIKGRQTADKNTCISNLRQIQGAIQLWSADARAASDASFTKDDIVPNYMKFWPKEGTAEYPVPANITAMPVCPNAAAKTDHKL